MLPKSIAQLTGIIVCSIVVFGTDMDVTYAMPLGILSGALAVFFVSRGGRPRCDRHSALTQAAARRRDGIQRRFQFLEAGLIFARHAAAADLHRYLRRIAVQMRHQDVADDVIEKRVLVDRSAFSRVPIGPTMP